MKVNTAESAVERSELLQETEFRMKASAKGFGLVIDKLYSDKILAIVRELSCNAYDSHIQAGKADIPFEVHLPTPLEPYFSVKDYGVGLDHQEMVNVYTVVFESTKDDSNDFTGAFGLGSKSPFSYVQSFVVTARKDGMERNYTAYINEKKIPVIALMNEKETSEPNGVEVSVPVKAGDMHTFTNAATKVFFSFSGQPKLINFTGKLLIDSPTHDGKWWKLYDTDYYNVRNQTIGTGPRVVMSNVCYPISKESLGTLSAKQSAILSLPITICFDNGSLDPAPSREHLSYDEITIKNILAKVDAIADEISEITSTALSSCKTRWDAICKRSEIVETQFPAMKSIDTRIANKSGSSFLSFTWKNEKIDTSQLEVKLDNTMFSDIRLEGPEETRHSRIRFVNIFRPTATNLIQGVKTININISKNVEFYFDDLKNGGAQRLKTKYSNGTSNAPKKTYLIQSEHGIKDDPKALAQAKKLMKLMGASPSLLRMTSSLPKPERKARKEFIPLVRWNKADYSDNKDCWTTEDEHDLADGGYYLALTRNSPRIPEKFSTSGHSMRDFMETIVELQLFDKNVPVFGVTTRVLNKIKKDKSWISLTDHVVDKLKALDKKFVEEVGSVVNLKNIEIPLIDSASYDLTKPMKFFKDNLDTDHLILKTLNKFVVSQTEAHKQKLRNKYQLTRLLTSFDVNHPGIVSDEQSQKEVDKVFEAYPLLKFVGTSWRFNLSTYKAAVDYIKLVDSCSTQPKKEEN